MRDSLTDLLEKADLALGSAAGVVEKEKLAPLIDAVKNVRTRLSYPDDILVVALAGGTGSGKSSLFNTLVGEELADVGGVRPTTSQPAAAVPETAGRSLDGYLDKLGVVERNSYPGDGICLLDLPDTDSVRVDHRHQVDALLPLVDLVVWVVDPEKYRDARLHDDYLKPLSSNSAQFVFVLNQTDRLREDDVEEVLSDLEVALDEDWLGEPTIVVTAASPPSGPPVGLDELWQVLESKRLSQSALYGKLLTDLAETCRTLSAEAGGGLDFDARAGEAVKEAADALVAGDPGLATSTLTGFLDTIASESGSGTGGQLEPIAGDVPGHIRRIGDDLARVPETSKPRRWFSRQPSDPVGPDPKQVMGQLSEAVIRPARAVLARRAVAVASIVELGLAVENLRRETPR